MVYGKKIKQDDFLNYSWIYYRIDDFNYLQGTDIKSFYVKEGYQIINYKEFNTNNISFKELFTQYSVHCNTEDKAKHFLQLCDDNYIIWNSKIKATTKEDFYNYGFNTVFGYNKRLKGIFKSDTVENNTITYEEFMDKLSITSIKEEINNNILKKLINKYLIKDGDFNKDSLSLIDFINECNDRFKLNLL